MKNRIAAPTKNSDPIIMLSLVLTGKEWNNEPPMAPGQIQQTAPATAKTMPKALISIVPSQPIYSNSSKAAAAPTVYGGAAVGNGPRARFPRREDRCAIPSKDEYTGVRRRAGLQMPMEVRPHVGAALAAKPNQNCASWLFLRRNHFVCSKIQEGTGDLCHKGAFQGVKHYAAALFCISLSKHRREGASLIRLERWR
jgi:hypothetical protein